MSAKLSVVVPFYGVEDYIDPCLASIRASTLRELEVVLVDDGSPDASRAVAERYASLDDRFRLITQANAGLGAARNTGADASHGQYLTFVDSDDLVAPRAFDQLVSTLDRTGSDFAAGNVWRLNAAGELYLSFAHAEAFAERVDRTTIVERPLLMRDRMIWNKVYRRSFWDAGGYRFPELRFEDFPVTLKAHLQARAVDLLPDPVYVWRERAAGTSISQQGHDIANVRDRVTTARMVIDTVDRLGTGEIRRLVHSHLCDVDLREVLGSLLSVPDAAQPEAERLASELVSALEGRLLDLAHPLMRTGFESVAAGDFDAARAIARMRGGEGPRAVLGHVPGLLTRPAARAAMAKFVIDRAPRVVGTRHLNVDLVAATASEQVLRLQARVTLREALASAGRVSASVGGRPVQAEATASGNGLDVTLTVPVAALPADALGHEPIVQLTVGPLRWRGVIMADGVQLPPPVPYRGTAWLRLTAPDGCLRLGSVERPAFVESAAFEGDDLVLATTGASALAVLRPFPDAAVDVVVTDAVARVGVRTLLYRDPADNPVTHVAQRPIVARDAAGDRPCFLVGDPAEIVFDDRRLTLGRALDGTVVFTHAPAEE